MKRVLIIGLLAILTLVAVPLGISSSTNNTAYAQELEIGEVIENRTQTSKAYYLGNNRYALDSYIGAIHYKDNYADPKEQWKDIDLTWVGNRITRAPYELTLEGNKITVRDKKTGEISTIELLEIGGIPIPPQVWERSKGLAKAFATDLEIVAGNGSVSFTRILKSSQAAVEAKYRVTGNMPFRVRASDTEGELPVEWTIKDGILTETLKPDRPIKYPVRIDPTIDKDVGATGDDAHVYNTTFTNSAQLRMGKEEAYDIRAFARFIDVTIPVGATIGANCYASFFVWDSTQPGVYLKVSADDSANPNAPTDATEVFAITPTTARVDWDDQADVDDWANTSDIQSVIAELQASYDYSAGAAITIIVDNDGGATSERIIAWSWDYDGLAPKLHIEYTEAGADPPTVTTQAATNIEATIATGNGNITAVNNGSCDIRGFVWDLATHGIPGNVAPAVSGYANDVPESDGFGTGAFTGSLTGLPTGDTIYVRAYAHNENGYGYGDEVNFLTKPAAPTNVSATDGAHTDRVVVTWTKSTGATSYRVYEGVNLLDTLGDIATFDDNTAPAGTITQGNTVASDGTDTAHIDLSLAGTSANNGAIRTYKVGAFNTTGDSDDSATDTGYRGVGVLTYQWQRSAGDGDAGYDDIVGAVVATYEDVDAPEGTVTPGTATASDGTSATYVTLSVAGEQGNDGAGRYYQCVLSAPDAIGQTSGSNRGYRTTGAITYQWQRSATDSNANYAPLGGATTDPYNDTTVPEDEGRWYCCEISATGVVTQNTTPDRGYLGDSGITTDEAEPLSVGYIILRIVPIVIAGVVCIFVIRRNMSAGNLLFGAVIGLLAFIIASAIIKLVGV